MPEPHAHDLDAPADQMRPVDPAHPGDPRPVDPRAGDAPAGGHVVRVPVRRAVNFRAFLVTGAIVGLLCGAVFAVFAPVATDYTVGSANVYCAAIGAVLGLLAGAVVALVLDGRS